MSRSKNPDLLFQDVLKDRAIRTSDLYLKGDPRYPGHLDRVTLFVTHRCNLSCSYCNGPHLNDSIPREERYEMLKADIKPHIYADLLDDWVFHGLKHLHFTGGEATLNPSLSDYVRLASEKGVLCSLTTNGTASPNLYQELVDNGLTEIRVSIDSADDSCFDSIVGVKGTCHKVKDNIRMLAKMRDQEKKNIFIILNACVGSFNSDDLKATVESLLSLDPDDAKLLAVAEESSYLCSKASRTAVDSLVKFVAEKGDYELLEEKIRRLFRRNSIGLKDPSAGYEMSQCFVPLTERTLDARGFYKCSIQLRYHSDPIAAIDSSFDEQQAAIYHFVSTKDCRDDDVCRDYCTNCCKEFNIQTAREIRKEIALKEAYRSRVVEVSSVSDDRIKDLVDTYDAIHSARSSDKRPVMIIKPHGLPHKAEILDYLGSQGVKVLEEKHISDWNRFSLFLYCDDISEGRLHYRIAKNSAHSHFDPQAKASLLLLEEGVPERKLFRIRSDIRNWFPDDNIVLRYKDEEYLLRDNCAHVADYDDLERTHRVIQHFLK